MTDDLYEYMLSISLREHPSLAALRQTTEDLPLADMQVPPEEAQFLQWLIRLTNAKKVLELGTFLGYSALAMALALPDDGHLITCDINPEWTKYAYPFWKQAGQEKKIDLRLAPAIETMNALINDGYKDQFDFIFIDADKTNYMAYYELALHLISPQGIIAIDNIFWDAKVIEPPGFGFDAQTREIRRLNEHIRKDERVDVSLVSIGDGLFLIRPH